MKLPFLVPHVDIRCICRKIALNIGGNGKKSYILYFLSLSVQCPVTCGQGLKTRYVACVISDNVITNDFECEPSLRPVSELVCNTYDCVRHEDLPIAIVNNNRVVGTSYWRTGPWSSVSIILFFSPRE